MLKDRIDSYKLVLEQREASLRETYTNLETSLAKMYNTMSYLEGQLASLSSK